MTPTPRPPRGITYCPRLTALIVLQWRKVGRPRSDRYNRFVIINGTNIHFPCYSCVLSIRTDGPKLVIVLNVNLFILKFALYISHYRSRSSHTYKKILEFYEFFERRNERTGSTTPTCIAGDVKGNLHMSLSHCVTLLTPQ